MEKSIVRLQNLVLRNIKNVGFGEIVFSNYGRKQEYDGKNSITAIYGQNGSGKTAVIEALIMLKQMFCGRKLMPDIMEYIKADTDEMTIEASYYIEREEKKYIVDYCFSIARKQQKTENSEIYYQPYLKEEILKASLFVDGVWKNKKTLFSFKAPDGEANLEALFGPVSRYEHYKNDIKTVAVFLMAYDATRAYDLEKKKPQISSFLFNEKVYETFKSNKEEAGFFEILSQIKAYGENDFSIIDNEYTSRMYDKNNSIPFKINLDSKTMRISGKIQIKDITVLPVVMFEIFESAMEQINMVLSTLIPGCILKIHNKEKRILPDGEDGVSFQIVTEREGKRVPLVYESAGIKKFYSICLDLVCCFNNPSYCLVIDELDSGIFEYLLGELMEILDNKQKGQLIFTSHNLRAIEVLDSKSVVFTTVNENNRYIRPVNIKGHQNMRSSYLRTLIVGGQSEVLYQDTDEIAIGRALRKAGKIRDDNRR